MAEVVSGTRIDWKQVEDKPALLEQILGTPYEELFDPQFGGPLYIGGARQEDGSMKAQRSSLLDVEVPAVAQKQMRGTSLVAAIQGEAQPQDLISETDYRQYTYKRSLIATDGWKLIYTLESRSRELYDLNSDPGEQDNLATAQPQKADELQARLFAHYRDIGHDLTARPWEPGLNPVYNSQAKGGKK